MSKRGVPMRKLKGRADEKQRRKALRRAREDESIADDLKAVGILERMADAIQADWSRTACRSSFTSAPPAVTSRFW
jgi:hypothetical protein